MEITDRISQLPDLIMEQERLVENSRQTLEEYKLERETHIARETLRYSTLKLTEPEKRAKIRLSTIEIEQKIIQQMGDYETKRLACRKLLNEFEMLKELLHYKMAEMKNLE